MNENEFSEEEEEATEESVHECESGFSILENDYRNITAKIQENEELAEIGDAYKRLFEAFYEAYQNEQELIQKAAGLEAQIQDNKEEIEKLIQNFYDEQDVVTRLEKKLAKSKLLADYAHAREQAAHEVIENMRSQIVKLNNELELKSRLAGDEEDQMGALSKTQEGFEREKQRMIDEITSLKQKLTNALSYSEELEHKNSAADLKTNELNLLLEQQTSEGTKKQRLIEKYEGDITALNNEIDQLHKSFADSKEIMDLNNKQISMLEMQLKLQRAETEKANKQGEMNQIKMEKAQMELEMGILELNDTKDKYADLMKTFKRKNDECNTYRSDVIKLTKQKDNLEKKLSITERLKYQLEQDKEKMRTNVTMMEREVHLGKRQSESDKKVIEAFTKEKEVLSKNLMRVQGIVESHMQLIKIQEQSKRKLEVEIHTLNGEINNQKKNAAKLEKERNKAMGEALDLTTQVEDAMDDNNIKQKSIYDLKKIIAELETKLRQQQNLFEAVRADRNAFQKQVQEVTSEIAELKSKLKISSHQGQQLKEDIASKEALLLQEENILRKVNKEKENLKIEVQNCVSQIHKLKHEIEELLQNERTLTKCIAENEKSIKKHEKAFEQIMNDRDVIGAQLVRRNDEIGLLSEKINILQTTLVRGETQYDQRIEDIKLLKLEIKRLRQEKNYLSKSIANMTDLKTEVFTLERELAQERLKCRALEEELQHPMNIHRWRKLEGSDPHIVDLLKKIQILQKRLLNQTSESIEREKQLKESEKLYLNLRQMLARQPGPDVKNELMRTKKALTMRATKMKCLVSELNMYETQALEYKMDVDKISKELKDTKKRYFKQKKICGTHFDSTKLPAINKPSDESTHPKFAGGGFKMIQ